MKDTVNTFYLTVVLAYCFYTSASTRIETTERYLPISGEITIQSPGYPNINYKKDTIYTWMVTAPNVTKEIFIVIKMDVHHTVGFGCYDYLQILEMTDINFKLFKQCGNRTTIRVARGNKLNITLYSNYDELTAKGFQLHLKVLKAAKPSTRKATTTRITSATSTLQSSKTTTIIKATTTTPTTQAGVTIASSTTKTSKLNTTSILNTSKILRKTAPAIKDSTINPEKKTNASIFLKTTGRKFKTSIFIPELWKTTEATKTDVNSQFLSSTQTLFASLSQTQPSSRITDRATKTNVPFSTNDVDMQYTSSSEGPNLSSIAQSVEITRKTTEKNDGFFFSQEMVILMVAVGMVEVSLVIVGILVVRRQRKYSYKLSFKKSAKTKRTLEGKDRLSVTENAVFIIPSVYDTIPFDEEDDGCDENPYKDLPDGFYDTITKRRSHVIGNRSDHSRGSYFSHLFRNSKIVERGKIGENQLMAFSTFRGSRKEGNKFNRSMYRTTVQNYADGNEETVKI